MSSNQQRRSGRWGSAALAFTLALGTAGLASATTTSTNQNQSPSNRPKSVTLITGDQVLVGDNATPAITPGPGREKISFSTFKQFDHLYVLPSDAAGLVADGRLDRRLFDISELVKSGYDDAKRDSLPLIVTPAKGQVTSLGAGVQVTSELPAVRSFAATVSKAQARDAWNAIINAPASHERIWLDGVREPSLDRSVPQIGAPAAHQAGYTGKGIKVAVLDTGIEGTHPDLAGREIAEKNFTQDPDATDTVGHGTHVAATIASSGPKYRGVAPDASLLDGKVCMLFGCQESWILGGMQWAVEQGADVVNLSLGGQDTPEVDPLEQAVNTLSAQHGTLFVIAAGNAGGPSTVGSPGSADAALTVGAVDRNDAIAPFSSRGPRVGDGAIKPDLTAPGVDIVAARASTGVIGEPGTTHMPLSGTSMATPHVVGAAALLAQQHPTWTGAQIKAALVASAKPNPDLGVFDQGSGRVDVAKAIKQTVTTDPTNVSLGLQQWPHDDDKPVTKELTYRNAGSTEVAFDLKIEGKGPDGKPAPAGLFSLGANKVTVPAGGTAKVAITGDTRVGTLDGSFSGTVVATSGTESLRTPVGVQREVESYDLTVNNKGLDGKPTTEHGTFVLGLDSFMFAAVPRDPDGSSTLRLPKGSYWLLSSTPNGPEGVNLLTYPGLELTKPVTADLDARLAKPISIKGPDAGAKGILSDVLQLRQKGPLGFGFGFAKPGGFEGVGIAHIGPALTAAEYTANMSAHFEATGSTPAKPAFHRYAFVEEGKAPTGFTRVVKRSELAEVKVKVGPSIAGRSGMYSQIPLYSSGSTGFPIPISKIATPSDVTNFVNSHKGTQWINRFQQVNDSTNRGETSISGAGKSYRPGHRYHDKINVAVFSASIGDTFPHIGRSENNIGIDVALHSDAADHIGFSQFDKAFTRLSRDGKLIGETPYDALGFFPNVPAGPATFRVDTEVSRSVSDLTTSISASWTFRSDTVPGPVFKPQPLSIIRFAPRLSDDNSAPAGQLVRVPLQVKQLKGADNGKIRKIEVEASFDDGKTWRKVPVSGHTALVRNPDAAGFTSLRAKATDSLGNISEMTVIHAYKIAKK